MNDCNKNRLCLNYCHCECNEECKCGHREHNGICIYVRCYCTCYTYNKDKNQYIEIDCICGHRIHNGNCYLAPSPCCEPIKCANYKYCNFRCIEKYDMIVFPFCLDCDSQMGKFKNTNIIKECNICYENKNILLLECNHEICNECWFLITRKSETCGFKKLLCPICRYDNKL